MEPAFGILFSLQRGTANHREWVVACLQGAWPKLIGDRLAAVCRPASLRGSELVVEVLDKSWQDALRGIAAELAARLKSQTAGEVRTVSIR